MSEFSYVEQFHGLIPSLEPAVTRPFWSVVIPTFNCAGYLQSTLESVLVQDPGPQQMEILVVDDCSTLDDPQAVVEATAGKRVRFIRQRENVGKAKNYESGISATRGYWIHQLHGDDLVGPGFYRSMRHCCVANPEAGAVFCESQYIDAEGRVTGTTGKEQAYSGLLEQWLDRLVVQQRIQTPSIVVRREVYESLGAFDRRLASFEDWEMWVRIASVYRFAFNAEAIAQYRVYGENTSARSVVSGERTRTLQKTLAIMDGYLPPDVLQRCLRDRNKELAYYLIRCIPSAVNQSSLAGWLQLCRDAMRYHFSARVIYYMLRYTIAYKSYL